MTRFVPILVALAVLAAIGPANAFDAKTFRQQMTMQQE